MNKNFSKNKSKNRNKNTKAKKQKVIQKATPNTRQKYLKATSNHIVIWINEGEILVKP